MALFDKAYVAAGKDGQVRRWVQAEENGGCGNGVCATVVVRWLKYKLVGSKAYWDVLENQVRWKDKWAKIGKKQAYLKDQMEDTPVEEVVHAQGQWAVKRISGHEEGTLFGGVKANKLRRKFAALAHDSSERFDFSGGPGVIVATVCEHQDCASYVGLGSTPSLKTAGGHAVGVYCAGDRQVSFFDPNMGEVSFKDRGEFEQWWTQHYRPAWDDDKNYRFYTQCRITRLHGLAEFNHARLKSVQAVAELIPERTRVRSRRSSFDLDFDLVVEFDELE